MARALWYMAKGQADIRDETVAPPALHAVRVRALHGAISRGTESLVFFGRVPPDEYVRMRAPFMGGEFPFPVKYGYATVGRVEAGAPDLIGRNVFTLHPHQTEFVVPAAAAVLVPEAVPPARAILAANMETALNALWDSGASAADTIAVVGGGVVGGLIAWLCGRMPGARVTLVDIDPARGEVAKALGVAFALPHAAPSECDVVFHASASAAGLNTALSLAGNEATIVEASWYGEGEVPVMLGGVFHSRRLRLISSQVSQIAPSHRARWSHRRRLQAALALLADPSLDVLLAPAIAFEDLPAALPRILAPGSGILCQRIDYPHPPH